MADPPVHLTVMSRAPVPGRTKTRLIPVLGAEGAAQFHAACLNDLLEVAAAWKSAAPPGARTMTLSITPPGSESSFAAAGVALPAGVRVSPQLGADLGERMVHALRKGLATADAALLIGADLPLLTAELLEIAAADLTAPGSEAPELALGPAADGGYYLIGVRRGAPRWPEVLAVAPWGTQSVFDRTAARARELGLRVALGERLPDADTPEDLREILAHPLAARLAGRRSLTWLRRHLAPP